MYLLLHLLHNRIEPSRFSPTQLGGRPLLYLECAHTRAFLNWEKDGGCTGCRRRRHVLMEEFWLTNNTFCLCVKSLCFHHNDITLYKISRHFFLFVCFTFKWSQVAYYTHFSTCSLLPSLVVHRSE